MEHCVQDFLEIFAADHEASILAHGMLHSATHEMFSPTFDGIVNQFRRPHTEENTKPVIKSPALTRARVRSWTTMLRYCMV